MPFYFDEQLIKQVSYTTSPTIVSGVETIEQPIILSRIILTDIDGQIESETFPVFGISIISDKETPITTTNNTIIQRIS